MGSGKCLIERTSFHRDCCSVVLLIFGISLYCCGSLLIFQRHLSFSEYKFTLFIKLLPPANEVWGKVIFLHLSFILFTGGSTWAGTPWAGTPLLAGTLRILLECILVFIKLIKVYIVLQSSFTFNKNYL